MKSHHWIVRVTHWGNVVALIVMVGGGLRIFNAYPAFAREGEVFCCYPFEHKPITAWLTFCGWIGGGGPPLLHRFPGVRGKGRVFLLLPFRPQADTRLADFRRMARRCETLALRGDVAARRQRDNLPEFRLPARRVARPGSQKRRRS